MHYVAIIGFTPTVVSTTAIPPTAALIRRNLIAFFLLYGSPVPGQIIVNLLLGFLKVLSFTHTLLQLYLIGLGGLQEKMQSHLSLSLTILILLCMGENLLQIELLQVLKL